MRRGGSGYASGPILVEEFREFKEFRSSGVQEFRSSGVQEFRSSGVQEFRVGWIAELREKTPSATGNVGVGPEIFTAGS